MPLKLLDGSLFDAPTPSIGQGVNIRGVMGSGIAVEFRRRFPDMYEEYRELCLSGGLFPGEVHRFENSDGTVIYNIASQDDPGRNARLEWLEDGVDTALTLLRENGEDTLALPRIGCGIGGLDWDDVRASLADLSDEYDIDIEVWTP